MEICAKDYVVTIRKAATKLCPDTTLQTEYAQFSLILAMIIVIKEVSTTVVPAIKLLVPVELKI
jgi:hypothetical protein